MKVFRVVIERDESPMRQVPGGLSVMIKSYEYRFAAEEITQALDAAKKLLFEPTDVIVILQEEHPAIEIIPTPHVEELS